MSCHAQKKPQLPSLAQEGFLFLWVVLTCLSGPGGPFLSCHVLFCVSSPGGLLIPPDFPREFSLGGGSKGSGCRGRDEGTEAKALKTICQSSQLRHGLLSSLHRHGLQSSQLRHGLHHLFRSGGPCPVVLSVSVLRGLQSVHPPSPVELLWRGTRFPGGVSYVRVLLCVMCSCLLCPYLVCFLSLLDVIIG